MAIKKICSTVKMAKKLLFFFTCLLLFAAFGSKVTAQTIQYSSKNVLINYPDNLHLVENVSGHHHLLCFTSDEYPELFIFDQQLKFQTKIRLPFKLSGRSELRIMSFNNFYYVYVYSRLTRKYLFWRIDGNGVSTNLTASFYKLSEFHTRKLGFQLIPSQGKMWMVYHLPLDDLQKNTAVIIQTDSLLNIDFTHKIIYDFKKEEDQLLQEALLFGKYLFILKTAKRGTSLDLLKLDISSGHTLANSFQSSGYYYSQSSFDYNNADSTVTISSLLTEPGTSFTPRRYIFISRLNKLLTQQVPFTLLKTRFSDKISTNFLLVDRQSEWMRLVRPLSFSDNPVSGVQFSLLDESLTIANDSLVTNTKDAYTLNASQFVMFSAGNKEYLLVGQQFTKRSTGLLLVNSNEAGRLIYTDVRVNPRNGYLLSKAKAIPQQGIIIPYIQKREAGLIKITIE